MEKNKKCNKNAILKGKSRKTIENKGFAALLQLFPLNGSRRLRAYVIAYPVHILYFL